MRENVTGRDSLIIVDALATALVALERLPQRQRPESNMEDMRAILAEMAPSQVSLHLAQAHCRFHPELDPAAVNASYGLTSNE